MHTKRIASGGQKGIKWTATPKGPHRKDSCKTLTSILKELGFADNSREAKSIVVRGNILVDGVIRKDQNYGAGLMDVVSIPMMKKSVRIVPGKNGLELKEVSDKDVKVKLCRVIGKRLLAKGAVQISLHDGVALLTDKKVSVGETVVVEIPSRKIRDILPYGKGCAAVVVSGRHRGKQGQIKEITPGTAARASLTTIDDTQTLTEYVFVIGKDKPQVEL
ncbi:MAG: S4 domain-containing protein [Candidatus Altiarchaeota archaeon]